jgi:hypothetical protein
VLTEKSMLLQIKRLCPEADVLKGIAIHGGSSGSADKIVSEWIDKLVIA